MSFNKIILIDLQAGKTLIANILGNEMSMDSSIGRPPYRPTNSVRIVEFSIPNVEMRKFSAEVDVQIWEIGGNPRYANTDSFWDMF